MNVSVITVKSRKWRHLDSQAQRANQKWVKTKLIIDVKMALADQKPAHASNSLDALLQRRYSAQLANVYSKQTAACSSVMLSAKACICARIWPVLATPASVSSPTQSCPFPRSKPTWTHSLTTPSTLPSSTIKASVVWFCQVIACKSPDQMSSKFKTQSRK